LARVLVVLRVGPEDPIEDVRSEPGWKGRVAGRRTVETVTRLHGLARTEAQPIFELSNKGRVGQLGTIACQEQIAKAVDSGSIGDQDQIDPGTAEATASVFRSATRTDLPS
jgi:hypothetical protein